MRSYSIERSTMEWSRIRNNIKGRNILVNGPDLVQELLDDIDKMLQYDNNHVHVQQVRLPDRVEKK